ncbi:hypothetical protein CsSME_00045969 [Camellia sinensis var. sinensis]
MANGGVWVCTTWKVPTKSVEPKLGGEAEDRVKKVREWREDKGGKVGRAGPAFNVVRPEIGTATVEGGSSKGGV